MKVTVIGGGVSGLTSGLCLAESGHDVRIVAREFGVGTTSRVATAIWHLFWVEVDERVERWAVTSLEELLQLTRDPLSGVTLVRGIECVRAGTSEATEFEAGLTGAAWKRVVPSYEPLSRESLVERLPLDYPTETLLGGYVIEVPIADMSVYLPYLFQRLDALGVTREVATFQSIADAKAAFPADWYVNCTGMGARELVPDATLEGIKGQIIRVSKEGSVTEYIADDFSPNGMTYILPRANDVILGGSEDRAEDSEVDPALAQAILARCTALVPEVGRADILEHMAGVRPYRPAIRLDVDPVDPTVVHNYGHGGSGVSLSWGCAREVAQLLEATEAAA